MTDLHTTGSPAPVKRPWTAGRVLARVAVAAMVGMWIYVLYFAIVVGRQPPRDRLEDPTFAARAQTICDRAHDDVARLPSYDPEDPAAQRAEVVSRANERFATMLDALDEIVPAGEDGDIVEQWLADWRTYLLDRADFVTALRNDPRAQLLVTAKDRQQITEFIDEFTKANRMIACATPIDVS